MKILFPFLIFCCFFVSPDQTKAQGFLDFQSLIEHLGEDQRNDFFEQLQQLDMDVLGSYLQECGAMDDLFEMLNGELPFSEFADLFGTFTNAGIYLKDLLSNMTNIPIDDQDVLLNQLDDIQEIYIGLDQSFLDIYNENINNIHQQNPAAQLPENLNLDPLVDNFDSALTEFDFDNTNGLQGIFDDIFNASLVNSLELAYGRKSAVVHWYGDQSPVSMDNLQVLRVGTVPVFEKDLEPFWSFTASWTDNNFGLVTGSEGHEVDDAFNPFIIEGDFGLMYNPELPVVGLPNARFITRLGFEVGTYMPPHIQASDEATYSNVGKTTGCGPQIGTGFAITEGLLTTYVMGLATYGVVSNCPYPYTNLKLEIGAKFNDAINLRYSLGQQDWANEDNKRVNTLQQVTVGLVLSKLFN